MVAVTEDVNLLLRKAIHFHDAKAKKKLLELILSKKEGIDLSSFKVVDKEETVYYDTLVEAILTVEEDIASAMMTRNEPLLVYYGYFLKQENWDAVCMFTRIYLKKFPCQNLGVFEALMEKALQRKNPTHAITLFKTIAAVDALTAEALRPMVEAKANLESSMVLKVTLDTCCPVEIQA